MFLMGDLGTCLDPADLFGGNSSEYSLAKLQGKRFILVNETDRPHELKKYNSTMVKQLVNSGSVQGRHPYGKPFDFDVIATIFVNSNHNPASFLPSEEGVLRRLALLEWNYTIDRSKMIDDFASQHLHPELSGILNWMLEGVKRHKEIGLKPPQQLLESMLSHFKEADTYHNFMICCVEQGSSKDRIKLTDLYNLYLEWYRANVSNGSLNLKHATLKLELERLGFDVKKGQGGAHFVYEVRFPDGFYIDSPDSINRLVKEGLAGFKATIFLKNNAFIKFRESGDLSNAA
jgi:putative DNA primase/helicase